MSYLIGERMSISWADPRACIFASSAAGILFPIAFVPLFRKSGRLGKRIREKARLLRLPSEGLQAACAKARIRSGSLLQNFRRKAKGRLGAC